MIPLSNSGGGVPINIIVAQGDYHAVYLNVSTDASVVGPITLCGHYPDADQKLATV